MELTRCHFVPPYLLEHLDAAADLPGSPGRETLLVDSGLRARRAESPPTPTGVDDVDGTKVVYSAGNTLELPGALARDDDTPPTGDLAADEAYDSAGQIHTLFATAFDRDSIDGAGITVSATVHYGQDYDNAFWDGSHLVFGDGDRTVFERFTKPPDVLFHEFSHGVTQFTAGLTYQGQSGALNESMSDCFASMCAQQVQGQRADEADWLIGAGLFVEGIKAIGLRSMSEPGTAYDDPRIGTDPQVGSMDDYVDTTEDNGGVHINSGIPNRAFYLAATGIGGNSWETPGTIWYAALTGGAVGSSTDFAGFAQATLDAAAELYGDTEVEAVRSAWEQVGVTPASPTVDTPPQQPERVTISRSGGFAGLRRSSSIDLRTSPVGGEIAALLARAGTTASAVREPAADRFAYRFDIDGRTFDVSEAALTPELRQVVTLVLGDRPEGS